jgi:hypothetical protein
MAMPTPLEASGNAASISRRDVNATIRKYCAVPLGML